MLVLYWFLVLKFHFSDFVDTLSSYREECDGILTEVGCALDYLYELKTKYVNVSTKTNALHDACEHLLAEQVLFKGRHTQLVYRYVFIIFFIKLAL